MLVVKNLPANAGDVKEVGSVPRSGTFLGEGFSNALQYSCLKNPMKLAGYSPQAHKESDMTQVT